MLARPMRGVVVPLVFAVAAVVAFFALRGGGLGDDPSLPPTIGTPADAGGAAANADQAAGGLAPGVVATRTQATDAADRELADTPSAHLRVVDRDSGQPVRGAPVRRRASGNAIAFTDEQGNAPIALREQEQLTVIADGYLLRRVPTRLGSTEAEPQLVQLVRDDWSIVRRLQFVPAGGGKAPAEVFVRFRPATSTKGTPSPVPASDAVATRAWSEHQEIASLPAFHDVAVQLGTWSENRVHRLPADGEVRFTAPAEYTIEAATTTGLAGRANVRIDAAPRTGAPPVRIELAPGAAIAGVVRDSVGARPLAGATITVQGSEPLGLVATTRDDGTFQLAPLLPGAHTLHVRHGDHHPLAFGPVNAPLDGASIALQPLPKGSLRGRVRARPNLRPIAAATVSWTAPNAAPVVATTDAEGAFTLATAGELDGRLAIQAIGYLGYAELVTPGSPFQDYDVWPAATAERLAAGLSAVLEGVVVDGSGRPQPDVDVRWQPATPAAVLGVPGRRTLAGATLELPLGARTGTDGAFRIETNAFGAGRVTVGNSGVDATATAGRTVNGLRLQQ
jgi:hypothetical protein